MVVKRRDKKGSRVVGSSSNDRRNETNGNTEERQKKKEEEKLALDAKVAKDRHVESLVPLGLMLVVLICSGPLWVLSFRDWSATGKVITATSTSVLQDVDLAMLEFTKSLQWFDDSHGWKSTQGGFSAIQSVTTDANNMGGFFVRKVAGAASLTYYTQKLLPLLFFHHNWKAGHFVPLLLSSILGNIAICIFYLSYKHILQSYDDYAHLHAIGVIALLSVETIVLLSYLIPFLRKKHIQQPQRSSHVVETTLTKDKSPNAIVSNIMMRTILIVTSAMAVIAGRDLFYPGQEIDIIPRDDIYLEWTNAFFHSPPPFTQEGDDYGLEAPLYMGDKFISQLGALYILLNCFLFKFPTTLFLRVGNDRSGETKCRIFWKVQAIGDAMLTFTFRVFANASLSASLDLRWHLMCLAYQTFMLTLYGFA